MDFQKRILLAALALLFFISSSVAQLKADFIVDKTGGCSPLTVSFTNTTTGASSNATYQWQFGNNNSSTLMNPGATFTIEQTYTITLIVTDGNKSSTQTKQITVYKKPTVDFSFDVAKGCLPLPVNFTANATASDGTIANYYWDFGDGTTQQTQSPQIQHTYNFAQYADVGLTVTNNYGCYSSVEKPAVKVLGAIQAAFSAGKNVLCRITDAVQFTNTSTGPGTLSYAWDFGDGTTSTAFAPSHTYSKKGIYTVKLTVVNTDGCTSTSVQSNYINAADYKADFDVPQLICRNSQAIFTDKSTPGETNQLWLVDNNPACYTCNYGSFNFSFYDTLNHTVQLINTYGTCNDTVTKQFTVKDIPDIKPFIINIPAYCNTPVTVNFKDTTKGAVKWLWNFDSYQISSPTSTLQAPSFAYGNSIYYYPQLTVTNAAGCTAGEVQNVNIVYDYVSIYIQNGTLPYACDSVTAVFAAAGIRDSIATYQWNFGDGTTSTLAQPLHKYTKPGVYPVTLNYITKQGCKGTSVYTSSITVYKRPVADFSVSQGTTICGNTPTTFLDKSNGPVTWWYWDFGNNNNGYSGNYYQNNPVIQYTDSGIYSVTLVAMNGLYSCADTITKTNYIKVLPPFPKISADINTCDGTRGFVKFTESSKYASSWKWDFGDGGSQSYNLIEDTITHTYSKSGAYKVVLATTNGQCTVKDSITAYVLLKQSPVLSAASAVCGAGPLLINLANPQTFPLPAYNFSGEGFYNFTRAQYGDSTNFTGFISLGYNNAYWYNTGSFLLYNLNPAKSNLRVISSSNYFGCIDTSNYIPLKINGPKAGFKFIENSPCFAYPVIMQDTSVASPGAPIKTWQWNFGDNGYSSKTRGGIESHIYTYPGLIPGSTNSYRYEWLFGHDIVLYKLCKSKRAKICIFI